MRLIVAEKRSVALTIASALGGPVKHGDGFVRLDGNEIVTWAQGHLVDLAMPGDYEGRGWDRWDMDALPIDPTPDWKWIVGQGKGAAAQYAVVSRLMRDADELVDACDPDREGEAIFRRIAAHAGVDGKPAMRLWATSLEEDAIIDALRNMRPEHDYDGLAAAAEIRAKADWLIGMNASRAYSLAADARLTVGRVQTPTLAMIVERDRRIDGHVPTPYWTVRVPMGGWTLTGTERYDDRTDAERILDLANTPGVTFDVTLKERARRHDRPPRLYDLTGLQKDMSRLHGLTAARTLAALQSLYEQQLTTYPRTDSRYITHDDLDTLRRLTRGRRLVDGFIRPEDVPASPRPELTVDDAKVAGHTAILPTVQAGADALDRLGEDERLVLVRVVRRMWEAVGDDYVHEVTVANARFTERAGLPPDAAGTGFASRSDLPVSLGWKSIERARPEDDGEDGKDEPRNVIPANLAPGEPATLPPAGTATMTEGITKPPKPFDEATLLAAMEHASRFVDDRELKDALDDDESHSGGIGTPATRADVIEKLVRSGYVEREGRRLRSTRSGRGLIAVVSPALRSVETTAVMERQLTQVERGELDPDTVMERFRRAAADIPAQARENVGKDGAAIPKRTVETYGPCPNCGEPVVRKGKFWECSTNKRERLPDGTWASVGGCGWRLYQSVCGRKLTDATVRTLLGKRRVHVKGFTSKAGRKFDADLIPDTDRGARFDFGK